MPGRVSKLLNTNNSKKYLAILIDPEKESNNEVLLQKCCLINNSSVDFILIGASKKASANALEVSKIIKENCTQEIIGFPGSASQINPYWDSMLFLSLIGSKNAQYLFEEQLKGTKLLQELSTEINLYPCGYLLIDGGKESSTEITSESKALATNLEEEIIMRCKTAEFLGMNHLYLEAGSGALKHVSPELVQTCKSQSEASLIVGGGIKDTSVAEKLWLAGAEVLVIGNYFEEHPEKISDYCSIKDHLNTSHAKA